MKRLFIAFLVVLAAATAFAGGAKDAPPAAQPAPQAAAQPAVMEKVTLNLFQHKPDLDVLYKEFAVEFQKENPNVTVVTETIGGGAVWQTVLKSKFAANEGPDIYPVEGISQYELWQEFIAEFSGEPWMKTALPFAMKELNVGGKQMGMPMNLEGYGYIYNKDIFAKAGITTLPKTFSELKAVAQKLKAAGYTPFATGYATWWVPGLHLMNMAFAQQDDPKGFIKALNEGKATMSGNPMFMSLKNLVDLTLEFGEKNPLTTDHLMQIQLFATGEAAMIQQGVWKEIPIYKANPTANIGLLPMPLNDDAAKSDRIAVGVPFYFVVNKASPAAEQKAAKAFLNYLVTTKVGQSYMTGKFRFIPAFSGVAPAGLQGVATDILKYSAEGKTIPWVFGTFPDGFAQEANNNIQAYVAGKQDWNTLLQKLDAAWQKLKK